MIRDKKHWYDGLFYDKVIAPNQDTSIDLVKTIVEKDSTLADLGCGTGRLALRIADKCLKIDGVDLSVNNIITARRNLEKRKLANVSFIHSDIIRFLKESKIKYDYAVLSYVIHEVDSPLREEIMRAASDSASKIILIDYLIPRPENLWTYLNEAVEFIAGGEHYRNFKDFVEAGGIKGLAEKSELTIMKEIINSPSTSHLVILEKQN
jgi:ubiquinone/menaquinone biosynthesis C-methylase UbiE